MHTVRGKKEGKLNKKKMAETKVSHNEKYSVEKSLEYAIISIPFLMKYITRISHKILNYLNTLLVSVFDLNLKVMN